MVGTLVATLLLDGQFQCPCVFSHEKSALQVQSHVVEDVVGNTHPYDETYIEGMVNEHVVFETGGVVQDLEDYASVVCGLDSSGYCVVLKGELVGEGVVGKSCRNGNNPDKYFDNMNVPLPTIEYACDCTLEIVCPEQESREEMALSAHEDSCRKSFGFPGREHDSRNYFQVLIPPCFQNKRSHRLNMSPR